MTTRPSDTAAAAGPAPSGSRSHPRLSPEQRAAAECPARLLRVVAGPGSGKSAIATCRFGLQRFDSADGRAVIGLSFTRAAVRVLRQRITDRWGAAALAWPHNVITIDELHRMTLEHLLASRALAWPMEPGTAITVIDAWGEDDGAVTVTRGAVAYRAGIAAGAVHPVAADVARSGGKAITSKLLLEDHLHAGRCTHDDIRGIVADALEDPALRAAVLAWVRASFRALIVDEAYDSNPLDIEMIRLIVEAGTAVTVIGDHWQALYEFRGATPELFNRTANALGFVAKEITGSFRFTPELHAVAQDLRHDRLVTLTPMPRPAPANIMLAHEWETLWGLGPAALPLAVGGSPKNAVDALLTLLLDAFLFEQLHLRAVFKHEAVRALGIDAEEEAGQPHDGPLEILRQATTSPRRFEDVAQQVADLFPPTVARRLRAHWPRHGGRALARFERLADRIAAASAGPYAAPVPGMTIHQAKGQEWESVAVAVKDADWRALETGLSVGNARHRTLYVGMTRARATLAIVKVPSAAGRRFVAWSDSRWSAPKDARAMSGSWFSVRPASSEPETSQIPWILTAFPGQPR